MIISAITGIIEPISYSLSESVAWRLTADARIGKSPRLQSSDGALNAEVAGITPLLQPVTLDLDGMVGLLVPMRLKFRLATNPVSSIGQRFGLEDATGALLAEMEVCGIPKHGPKSAIVPFLAWSRSYDSMAAADLSTLRGIMVLMTGMLWPTEPLKGTTDFLHLASDNTYRSAAEIARANLGSGTVVIRNGSFSIRRGSAPMVVAYRPDWENAGDTTGVATKWRHPQAADACSGSGSSSSGGSGSSGGFGSGSGGGGSGGGSGGGFGSGSC